MVRNIVFDIRQVLLVWDPLLLYQQLIPDKAERDFFFETVLDQDWRDSSSFFMSTKQNCELKVKEYPDYAAHIHAWNERFFEMMPGPLPGAWDLTTELQAIGCQVYSIANFAPDKYAAARVRFPFLNCLNGMLVSSEVNLRKPDPDIFNAFLQKFGLENEDCIYIGGGMDNIRGAESVGMTSHCHQSFPETRTFLKAMGIPLLQ